MYYREEFLQSLPQDPPSALLRITGEFYSMWESLQSMDDNAPPFALIIETHALLSAYFAKTRMTDTCTDADGLPIVLEPFTGSEAEDQAHFLRYIQILQKETQEQINKSDYAKARQQYGLLLGSAEFHYEFSEGDLARIQGLVNELRDLIVASEELGEHHKRRVLSRLEKLQTELHKKISDLSWVWGGLIEASIAAKLIGKNAKPIVDRIREIARIVWPMQARTFELPSDTPFKLPGQTEGDGAQSSPREPSAEKQASADLHPFGLVLIWGVFSSVRRTADGLRIKEDTVLYNSQAGACRWPFRSSSD